jgi:hypothetical protein
MTNPFHSFHIQNGGVPLKKLTKHYRKRRAQNPQQKTSKFHPLLFQEREDLVVPMDLIVIPSSALSHHCHYHPLLSEEYPEPLPEHGRLEVIEIHTISQEESYEHPSVIDDQLFEHLFQNISIAPRSKKPLKQNNTRKLKKQEKKSKRKSRNNKQKLNP